MNLDSDYSHISEKTSEKSAEGYQGKSDLQKRICSDYDFFTWL